MSRPVRTGALLTLIATSAVLIDCRTIFERASEVTTPSSATATRARQGMGAHPPNLDQLHVSKHDGAPPPSTDVAQPSYGPYRNTVRAWTRVPGRTRAEAPRAGADTKLLEVDFEDDPSNAGWVAAGKPVRVSRGRIDPDAPVLESEIGGDYWKRTYWPGQSGDAFVELRKDDGDLTSPQIAIPEGARYLSLLVGGTGKISFDVDGHAQPAPLFDEKRSARGAGADGRVMMGLRRVQVKLPASASTLVVHASTDARIVLDDLVLSSEAISEEVAPAWGFVDLHAHPLNHLTFGGRFMAGRVTKKPLDADLEVAKQIGTSTEVSMKGALGSCEHNHGSFGDGVMSVTPEISHNHFGYPTFDGWPNPKTLVHQQMYIDWIKRAWQGGLRILNLDAGNNEFAALDFEAVNGQLTLRPPYNPLPVDDMSSIVRTVNGAPVTRGPL